MSRLTIDAAAIFLIGLANFAVCPTSGSAEEKIGLTPPEDKLLSEKLDVSGSRQAGVSALLLRAVVRNRQGSILEDLRIGLRIPARLQANGYEGIPITEWLGDPELNRSSVERAVQPLLMRLRVDLPDAPGPNSGRAP